MDQYLTISDVAADQHMRARVAACAAQQGSTEPEHWAYVNAYIWAASPGWAATWDSAVAGGVAEPGKDPAVIQDSMILARVQGMLAT
jgi:hypothetical protein